MLPFDEQDKKEIQQLLKQAIPPARDTELRRDLWPQMLKRLDQQATPVPWFDWALAGLLGAALIFFPRAIPALLYHL